MPAGFDFEFIEVDDGSNDIDDQEIIKDNVQVTTGVENSQEKKEERESDDEFDFPLFSAPIPTSNLKESTEIDDTAHEADQGRGRLETRTMKVSLREESIEVIKNERPLSYYRAIYTEKEKKEFIDAAILSDDIYKQISISIPIKDPCPWKCMNLNEHNAVIQSQILKQKEKHQKRRAGKNKRSSKIGSQERKVERRKVEKKLKKEKEAKIKKQFYGRYKGKSEFKLSGRFGKKVFNKATITSKAKYQAQ